MLWTSAALALRGCPVLGMGDDDILLSVPAPAAAHSDPGAAAEAALDSGLDAPLAAYDAPTGGGLAMLVILACRPHSTMSVHSMMHR